jgi:hypothetical protein
VPEALLFERMQRHRQGIAGRPIHDARLLPAYGGAGERLGEWRVAGRRFLPGRVVSALPFRGLMLRVVMAHEKHAVGRVRCFHGEADKPAHGIGQGHRARQRGRRLNQRHRFLDGHAKLLQAFLERAGAFRGTQLVELFADGPQERFAIQVLVLVEIVAHAHSHRVERRRLVRVTRD